MVPRSTAPQRLPTRPRTSYGNRTSTAHIDDRVVKDATYYKGELLAKNTKLRTEIARMRRKIDSFDREDTVITINTKKAKTMAEELTAEQARLNDLNIAVDAVNVGAKLSQVQKELADLRAFNDQIDKEHEVLYGKRIEKQAKISEMRDEISRIQLKNAVGNGHVKNVESDPRKSELVLELQLSLEDRQTATNMPKTSEDELDYLFNRLAFLVVEKLRNISERVRGFPKPDAYETFVTKNMTDFAGVDTTPRQLLLSLSLYLEQIKIIARNVDVSLRRFKYKTMDLKGAWSSFSLADLENAFNRKTSVLKNQKTALDCRRHSLQMTLDTRSEELDNYHRQLMKSKDYSRICDLEMELSKLRKMNFSLQEYLEDGKCVQDLQECQQRSLDIANRLNEQLKSSLIKLDEQQFL